MRLCSSYNDCRTSLVIQAAGTHLSSMLLAKSSRAIGVLSMALFIFYIHLRRYNIFSMRGNIRAASSPVAANLKHVCKPVMAFLFAVQLQGILN